MKNSSFGYIIGSAFRGMRKHLMMTTASVSVLIACMIIIGTAYLFAENVSNFMTQIEQQNEIVAFMHKERAYVETEQKEVISFAYAEGLQI